MNALSRLFSRRRRASVDRSGDTLLLWVGEAGWRARIGGPSTQGPNTGGDHSGKAPPSDAGTAERLEAAFSLAARGLRKLGPIGSIQIALDDPEGLYLDLMSQRLATGTSQYLHEFGKERTGHEQVTIGRTLDAPESGLSTRNGAVGFQNLRTLNACLTRLDDLATRVVRVVPVTELMRRRVLETAGEPPAAAIHMGAHHTHVLALHPRLGSFTARVVGIGYRSIAEALRGARRIDVAEAAKQLASRDLLSDIAEHAPLDADEEVRRNATDRAIGDMMRQLADSVREALSFFEQQRMSGRPARMTVLQSEQPVEGLAGFLSRQIDMDTAAEPFDVLALLDRTASTSGMNLLDDVGGDLQIGPTAYRFHHGMIRSVEELAREEPAQSGTRRHQESRRGGARRQRRGRGGAPRTNGPIGGLFSRGTSDSAAGEQPDQDRQVGLLAVLILLAVGYFGYNEIEAKDLLWRNQVNALNNAITKNITLKKDTAAPTKQVTSSGEIDKVLWTEKFLALAENMNETMWLTDVYLEVNNRTIGESEIEEKKLVIQGAVLPSTDGHILQIAEFIGRLEQDRAGFMDDFREILFEGAFLDREEADPVIRFAIEARYDAKKRQNAKTASGPGKSATSLGEVQETTKARNKAQESSLPASIR